MDLVLAGVRPLSFLAGREKNAVSAVLTAQKKELGCKNIGHVYVRRDGPRPETFVSVTYPGRWLINYAARSYFSIDPVINHSERTHAPIILNDVARSSRAVGAMIADARRFGIGKSFVSFTVMPASDLAGNVMFSFDVEPEAFTDYFDAHHDRLKEAARRLHLDILAARGFLPHSVLTFELDVRERACLTALAHGKAFDEIAATLGASRAEVTALMGSVCTKLGCANSMQAVSRALSLGLVEDRESVRPPRDALQPMPDAPATRH